MSDKNPFDIKKHRKSSKKKFIRRKKKKYTKKTYKVLNRFDTSSDDSDSGASSDGSVVTVSTNFTRDTFPSRPRPGKKTEPLSAKDIKYHLRKYVQITPEDWKNIDNKQHIKFFNKKASSNPDFSIEAYKNEFDKYGGFVQFRKERRFEDGTSDWILGISFGFHSSKDTSRVLLLRRIKSIWKKKDKNVKPEINQLAHNIRGHQETTTGNQVILQEQINSLQFSLDKLKIEQQEFKNDIKSLIEKKGGELENLVEYIRQKDDRRERRHSR